MKQILREGPGTGRRWQASPNFRTGVRGCDLTSLASSSVGLLGRPRGYVARTAAAAAVRALLRPLRAAEQGLHGLLPSLIPCFGESHTRGPKLNAQEKFPFLGKLRGRGCSMGSAR